MKSDSQVTHIQTQTTNSVSWAAAQILVQFFFTLAGPLAVSPLHISFRGYLLIWAVYAQNPGLTPLSLSFLGYPLTLQLLWLSQTLSSGSSGQKDYRFSIGVLAALPSLVWELPLG